jgi:hypothetical protein
MTNEERQKEVEQFVKEQPEWMRLAEVINGLLKRSGEMEGAAQEFDTLSFDREVGWEAGQTLECLAAFHGLRDIRWHPSFEEPVNGVIYIGVPLTEEGDRIWSYLAQKRRRSKGRPFSLNVKSTARQFHITEGLLQEFVVGLARSGIIDCVSQVVNGGMLVTRVQETFFETLDRINNKPDGFTEWFFTEHLDEQIPKIWEQMAHDHPEEYAQFCQIVEKIASEEPDARKEAA